MKGNVHFNRCDELKIGGAWYLPLVLSMTSAGALMEKAVVYTSGVQTFSGVGINIVSTFLDLANQLVGYKKDYHRVTAASAKNTQYVLGCASNLYQLNR